jgi:RNA polymerase sigma-70 factor (ECF subfamily)
MKIIISESQYKKLHSYNNHGVNLIINEAAGKTLEPLSEGWLNTLADIVGIFDPTGLVDIGNAISYWSQGKNTFALLTLVSAIPGVDWATKPFVLGGKIVAGISKIKILGWLVRTMNKWVGKALDMIDKMLLSKIPIVKNFADAMRSLINGLKKDSQIKLNESKLYKILTEDVDFDKAYRELFPKIYKSVCLKYAKGDDEKAQDFCQDGFIKAYNKLSQFRGDNLGGWIAMIVRNNILDELRKEKGSKIQDFDFGRYDAKQEEYDDSFMGKYTEKDIQDAINSLSPQFQKVFRMYYFDDMKHQEIAKELGISESTSKTNLLRAKAKVKDFLENLKEA